MWHAWGEEKYVKDLVGHPEGRRLNGRYSHGWEANMKWIIKKIGWEGAGLVLCGLGQQLLVDCCEESNKPLGSIKFRNFLTTWP